MEYKISQPAEGNFILVKLKGEISSCNALDFIHDSQEYADKHKTNKILVDSTEAVNVDSIADNYRFVHERLKDKELKNKKYRVATVVAKDDSSHDFVATVSANEGINTKIFKDINEAKKFLLE